MFPCTGRKLQCHFKDTQLYPSLCPLQTLGPCLDWSRRLEGVQPGSHSGSLSVFTFLFSFSPILKTTTRKAVVKGDSLKNGLVDIS